MSTEDKNIQWNVPEPTLRRLPWYLAYVKLLKSSDEDMVSSTRIAKKIGVDPSQVAKDLSFVNITGKTRVGYEIDELIRVLGKFLGFTDIHRAVLFGVGSLGAALLQDSGLSQYGLQIVAAFDISPKRIGTKINTIPIYHTRDLPLKIKELGVNICVLTVPILKAQEVTDWVIGCGIKAIWNFTPYRIKVPHTIIVQNTSLYSHLAVMFNRINAIK